MNSVTSAETGREPVVQDFLEEAKHRIPRLGAISEKHQTTRCYGISEFVVTPHRRRRDVVLSVKTLQHRKSLGFGVLLRQLPSEKEWRISIGTTAGRLGREETATNSETSSADSVMRSLEARFVGLHNGDSLNSGIERLLGL